MQIELPIIAAVFVIAMAVIGYANKLFSLVENLARLFGHKSAPVTKRDFEQLVEQFGGRFDRLAEYLPDGLAQDKDPIFHAAFEEGQRLQEEGDQAQDAHKHQEAIDRFTRALRLAKDDSQRAALHNLRGNSYVSISQYDNAKADYEETLKLSEGIPERQNALRARAAAVGNLGNVYRHRGDLQKAEERYRQALETDRGIGNRPGQATHLGNLGIIYAQRAELDKAAEHFEGALAADREIGNRPGEARHLNNLGLVYADCGDLDKAEEHFQQALKIDREIGNRLGEASALGNLGSVYYQRDDLEKAEEHLKQALEIAREIGDRLGEANRLGNLGLLYRYRGDTKSAREYLQQAQALYLEIGAGGEGLENVRRWLEELERRQQERGK